MRPDEADFNAAHEPNPLHSQFLSCNYIATPALDLPIKCFGSTIKLIWNNVSSKKSHTNKCDLADQCPTWSKALISSRKGIYIIFYFIIYLPSSVIQSFLTTGSIFDVALYLGVQCIYLLNCILRNSCFYVLVFPIPQV